MKKVVDTLPGWSLIFEEDTDVEGRQDIRLLSRVS